MNMGFVILLIIFNSTINTIMMPLQARNGQILGIYWATFIFLGIGTIATIFSTVFYPDTILIQNLSKIPFYVYSNGLLNVITVIAFVKLVPKAGVGLTLALSTFGQFSSALVIDHFGLFGLPISPINLQKLLGVLLILVGTVLFSRRNTFSTKQLESNDVFQAPQASHIQEWPLLAIIGMGIGIGISQTIMPTINASSGRIIGISGAMIFYLGFGMIVSLILGMIFQPRVVKLSFRLPFYHYFPGITNVLLVGLPAIFMPLVGVSIYTSLSFLGSASSSIIFDSIGIFGMPKIPVNTRKVIGVVIMLLGVILLKSSNLL